MDPLSHPSNPNFTGTTESMSHGPSSLNTHHAEVIPVNHNGPNAAALLTDHAVLNLQHSSSIPQLL